MPAPASSSTGERSKHRRRRSSAAPGRGRRPARRSPRRQWRCAHAPSAWSSGGRVDAPRIRPARTGARRGWDRNDRGSSNRSRRSRLFRAHVDEDVRMIEGWHRTHAHEFLGADTDRGDAGLVVEMRDSVVGHVGSIREFRCANHSRAGLRRAIGPGDPAETAREPTGMQRFSSMARSRLPILDEGEGPPDPPGPRLRLQSSASTGSGTGWVETLKRAGRRVIALDNRGHGASTKLYEPADYHTDRMADDAAALLDHLGIERAVAMGYSMGARITAFLALAQSRPRGGAGSRRARHPPRRRRRAARRSSPRRWRPLRSTRSPIRWAACSEPSPTRPRRDRRALAACIRGSRQTLIAGARWRASSSRR